KSPTLALDTRNRTHHDNVSVHTVGLPAGVKMLIRRDDVRAMAGEEWVGTSWGLVRYQKKAGLSILQIPLGDSVSQICPTPHGLFVATFREVFLIEAAASEKPRPVRLVLSRLDGEEQRMERAALLWWQGWLWIDTLDGPWRYNPVRRIAQYLRAKDVS